MRVWGGRATYHRPTSPISWSISWSPPATMMTSLFSSIDNARRSVARDSAAEYVQPKGSAARYDP
jgi:hypothetical protein